MTIIAHIDMDAFFASVEERDKPWLRGLPVVVGADPQGGKGRGVVSAANYIARTYGIRSALPIGKAWHYSEQARKSGKPAVAFITPRFNRYSPVSKEVMAIVKRYAHRVEQTSVDEAYFDFPPAHTFSKAEISARTIKREIRRRLKLTASIGIGPNRMIAKIASDFKKPDGLTVVKPENVKSFLDPLSVRVIPGVGPKMGERLLRRGITTIHDLRKCTEEELHTMSGSWGKSLYRKARGEGSTTLNLEGMRIAKSIGEHETFREDSTDLNFVLERLSLMASRIIDRHTKKNFSGFRTVVLTIRFMDFDTKSRSITTKEPQRSVRELEQRAYKLVIPFFEQRENPLGKPIRMIGLRIEKLVHLRTR